MKAGYYSLSLVPNKTNNCIYVENWEDNEIINQPMKRNYKKKFKKIDPQDVGVWKIKQLKTNN